MSNSIKCITVLKKPSRRRLHSLLADLRTKAARNEREMKKLRKGMKQFFNVHDKTSRGDDLNCRPRAVAKRHTEVNIRRMRKTQAATYCASSVVF